jgi:hypothetical protein
LESCRARNSKLVGGWYVPRQSVTRGGETTRERERERESIGKKKKKREV